MTAAHAGAYASTRQRLVGVLAALDERQLSTTVPACPAWRVRDVAAHLVGNAADMLDARFPTGDVEAWTAEQVEARRSLPFASVLEEWEQRCDAFAEALSGPFAGVAGNFVADIVSHELDIRNALGWRDGRDVPELGRALETFAAMCGGAVDGAKLPALVLRWEGGEIVAGTAEPGAAVSGSRFELLRAISGRRTPAEVTELAWDGDVAPYLPVLSPYPPPARSLGE